MTTYYHSMVYYSVRIIVRPVHLLRVSMSEGLTQADS